MNNRINKEIGEKLWNEVERAKKEVSGRFLADYFSENQTTNAVQIVNNLVDIHGLSRCDFFGPIFLNKIAASLYPETNIWDTAKGFINIDNY